MAVAPEGEMEHGSSDTQARRVIYDRRLIAWVVGVAAALLVGALVIPLVARWTPADQPDWWGWAGDVLINIGAAGLLVIPLELVAARLRREVHESEVRQDARVEAVRQESAERLDELAERVDALADLEGRVRESLDDVTASDRAMYRALVDGETTGEQTYRALSRANKRRLISRRGVRVYYNDVVDLVVIFQLATASRPFVTVSVADGANAVASMNWVGSTTAEEMLVTLGVALRNKGVDQRPSARRILGGLADTLVFADEHDFARPIIQYFEPQWALTENAVVAAAGGSGNGYAVTHSRPDRTSMRLQVAGKAWLDEDSFDAAWAAAIDLFPLSQAQKDAQARDTRQR